MKRLLSTRRTEPKQCTSHEQLHVARKHLLNTSVSSPASYADALAKQALTTPANINTSVQFRKPSVKILAHSAHIPTFWAQNRADQPHHHKDLSIGIHTKALLSAQVHQVPDRTAICNLERSLTENFHVFLSESFARTKVFRTFAIRSGQIKLFADTNHAQLFE